MRRRRPPRASELPVELYRCVRSVTSPGAPGARTSRVPGSESRKASRSIAIGLFESTRLGEYQRHLRLPSEHGGMWPSIEGEGSSLQEQVARAYEQLADAEPGRWRRVDAGRPADEIHAEVLTAVEAARAAAAAA